jgi:uncharacterized protein DUF1259
MRAHSLRLNLLLLAFWAIAHPAWAQGAKEERLAADAKWAAVAEAAGRPGRMQADGTYTVFFPRGDLDVKIGDLKLAPLHWMASSVTFSAPGEDAMMMGDLLATDTEIATVMPRLAAESIDITAVQTHLIRETPRLMYMHVESHGDAVKIAQGLRRALSVLKQTPPASIPPLPADFDLAALDTMMGQKGRVGGGGIIMNVPRREAVTTQGMTVPESMGSASVLHFQPLEKGKVAITGDLVLLAPEVNPVIRVLVQNGIEITTIHSHMLTESPRLFFLHYWAVDDQAKITKGLRAALEIMNPGPREPAPK